MIERNVYGVTSCTRCSRPSMQWSQLCRLCYDERAKEVYWNRGPACRAKGPDKAECLLAKGHEGDHEGNGYDSWGQLGRMWSNPYAKLDAGLDADPSASKIDGSKT